MMGTGVIQGSRDILCDLFINTFKSLFIVKLLIGFRSRLLK